MNNIVSILLCLIIGLSMLEVPTIAKANNSKSVQLTEEILCRDNINYQSDEYFEMEFSINDMEYYPFIYDEEKIWENKEVVGPNLCEEGFLYVKNLNNGEIKKLLNVKVDEFVENENGLYFVVDNHICFVDFKGEKITNVYSSQGIINRQIIELYNNELYFVENEKLLKTHSDGTAEVICEVGNITSLLVIAKDEFVIRNGEITEYIDLSLQTRRVIDDEKFMGLVSEQDEESVSMAPANPNPGMMTQKDVNLESIISSYAPGSYFTQSGYPCGHHSTGTCSYFGGCNCKPYNANIQCSGFAQYAFDKYSHRTYWHSVSGDQIETNIRFDSISSVKAFFSSLTTGAYIRLSHYDDESGFHSLFFIKRDSSNVTTFECNIGGTCKVNIFTCSYESWKTRFNTTYGIYRVTHNFASSAVSVDSNYHKYVCKSTGCGGYIIEHHYSAASGTSKKCEACGYVGEITYMSGFTRGDY